MSAIPQKQTNAGAAELSAKCQSRPMHRSKQHLHSITSSAVNRRFTATLIPSGRP
jgi:hypothetical protein